MDAPFQYFACCVNFGLRRARPDLDWSIIADALVRTDRLWV
jgi:hypothetical protein